MITPIIDAHAQVGHGSLVQYEPEQFLAAMDQHGIATSMVSPMDRQMAVDNREGNDALLTLIQQYPDRILGYATVNPWYGERAVAELRRALRAGLHGLKLHPAVQGFVLIDPLVDPVIRVAAEFGVPVYVHTGTPVHALPMQVAHMARRHPDVMWIMGRMGTTDFKLDVPLACEQVPNILVDTAFSYPATIQQMVALLGADRVLFSTDAPFCQLELALRTLEELDLPPAELAKVAGGNLLRLVGKEAPQC